MPTSVLCCDLCNIYLPVDENSRNLWAANCTRVKIDLWLSSNTAEISLKCLTCCNKLRATISYICYPCCSLLYWMFFLKAFPDVTQVVKSPVGQFGFDWWFIFKSSNLTLCSSQNKKEFSTLPLLTVSQIWCNLKTCKKPGCVPSLWGDHHRHLPPALNGKLCQWSRSFSLGLTVLLSWLAGEAASHRQSRPVSSQWEGGEGGSSHCCQDNHLWMSLFVECGQMAVI